MLFLFSSALFQFVGAFFFFVFSALGLSFPCLLFTVSPKAYLVVKGDVDDGRTGEKKGERVRGSVSGDSVPFGRYLTTW